MKRFLFIVFCAAAILSACDKEDQQQAAYGDGVVISIDPSQMIRLSPVGETISFSLTSNRVLRITKSAVWFSLIVDGTTLGSSTTEIAAGYHEIIIKASCADQVTSVSKIGEYRNGSITLSCDGYMEAITIRQPLPYLFFDENPSTQLQWTWADKYGESAKHATFDIISNIKWKVTADSSSRLSNCVEQSSENDDIPTEVYMATRAGNQIGWFAVNTLAGENNGTLEIAPAEYNYNDSANANTISISADTANSLDSYITPLELSCSQSNLKFNITQDNKAVGDKLPASFKPCDAEAQSITIDSEEGLVWEITTSNWVSIKDSSDNDIIGGEGGNPIMLHLNAETNPNRDTRSADVRFNITAGGASATRSFSIEQEAFVHDILDSAGNTVVGSTTTTVSNTGDPSDDSSSISVKSSGDWTSNISYNSDTQDWLTVTPALGSGMTDTITKEDVTIQASCQNPEMKERTATLRIESVENDLYRDLTVAQAGFIFEVDGSTTPETIEKDDENDKSIQLKTSGSWSAESDKTWLSVITLAGNRYEADTIRYKVSINTSADERQGTITLKSTYHESNSAYAEFYTPITITIKQHGSFVVEKSGQTLSFGATDNLSQQINVQCLAKDGWYIKTKPEWLTVAPNSSHSDSQDVEITAKMNTSYESRNGEVVFAMLDTGENVEKSRTVYVKQDAYIFTVSSSITSSSAIPAYNTNGYRRYSATINCSGLWRASTTSGTAVLSRDSAYSESLTESVGDGSGDTLYIFVKNNNSTYKRDVRVTISCNGDTQSDKNPYTLSATQSAYEFAVDKDVIQDIAAEVASGDITEKIKVTCSGKWVVEANLDWISCNPSSGEGDSDITITLEPNNTQSSRSGVVLVRSTDLGISRSVTLQQKSVSFLSIDPNTLSFSAVPSQAQTVKIDCTGSWEYDAEQSEIEVTVTPAKGFGVSDNVSIKPNPNYTDAAIYNKKVYFVNKLSGLSKFVYISVEAYQFSATPAVVNCGAKEDNGTIEITCSGSWSVSEDIAWLECSKEGDNKVRWTVTESNPTDSNRSGEIIISSEDNPSLKDTPIKIKVTQQ